MDEIVKLYNEIHQLKAELESATYMVDKLTAQNDVLLQHIEALKSGLVLPAPVNHFDILRES